MSKYTTQLRYICESVIDSSESVGENNIEEVIQLAIPHIFDFNFPIYNENHRNVLETKILRHYYMREIGVETVGLWKHYLNMKLNEIMPYYNELYKSAAYLINPLDDVDYQRVIDGVDTLNRTEIDTSSQSGDANNSTNSRSNVETDNNTNNEQLAGASSTPQGRLTDLKDGKYLTTGTHAQENSNSHGNTDTTVNAGSTTFTHNRGEFNTKEDKDGTKHIVESVKGKMYRGSKAKLITEYRKAILNIDMMIIDELSTLFMLIY